MTGRPVALMWSGGKDAVLALEALKSDPRWSISALVTTVTEHDERVTSHGVSRLLVARQAGLLGLPLYGMHVPVGASNAVYEQRLASALAPVAADGIDAVACGDIYLEDVRAYRETLFARLGVEAVFPIWGRDSASLADQFLTLGYGAVVTSVLHDVLPRSAAGFLYDRAFLERLPADVDPCGERGEFHTFTFAGPAFEDEIGYRQGRTFRSGPMWILPLDEEDAE